MGLNSLSPALDTQFAQFYSAVSSGALPDEASFDAAAAEYLTQALTHRQHDAYFENFTPLWRGLLEEGRHTAAASVWPWALRSVLALEAAGQARIHKGTPYYFWGMTSLLAGNLQDGYLQMHRALEEDNVTHGTIEPDTPGFALATLDHTRPDQAFRPWVEAQARAVEQRLEEYRTRYGRKLDLTALRARVLAVPAYREWTQTYCFAMATASRLLAMPRELWDGFFSAQLGLNVLFDLCLVVDAMLHAKNPSKRQFIDQAAMLSKALGFGLSKADLKEINGHFNADFDATVRALLGTGLALANGVIVTALPASLAITYGCRNRAAHDLRAVALSSVDFNELVQRVNETFFISAEELYP